MTEEKSSYRQIMKATSLFGGVQVFNIIISIARSKFVAILLGPTGMGIMGLLNSTLGLIGGLTNLGLGTSAVKDVSAAYSSNDSLLIAKVITVFRRIVWVTGSLGAIIVIIFSSWLSQLTFGNNEYTIAFIWISISLLFNQLSSGQLVILQGMRKHKHLAQANVLGSVFGLIITIPIYYFFGVNGIAPAIIIVSVVSLLSSWTYARKIKIAPQKITIRETDLMGRNMIRVGLMISLGGLLSSLGAYVIRIYMSNTGGIGQVGLYHAGFAIINMYMGVILKGMSTDYYPRLSAASKKNEIFILTIQKQTDIGLLILGPLLIIFIVVANWVVILLYSKQFLPITDMITWAALGMLFRGPSWCLSFVFLAKGEGTLYFYLKFLSESLLVGLSVIGYYTYGLTGLGISILVMNPIYFLVVYKINRKRINFKYKNSSISIFAIQLSIAIISFLAILNLQAPYNFTIGTITILLSIFHSLHFLNKKLGLFEQVLEHFRAKK